MYELQTSVKIGQASFGIRNKGDFRMVLDCFKALNDTELTENERIMACLIIFYEDFDSIDDILEHEAIISQLEQEMAVFFDGGEKDLKSNTHNYKVMDWDKDSNLICSAVNNIAGKEIRALDYLHWWTFLGYYTAIKECLLSEVITIRYKKASGEKLEKHERKFMQENPQYFNLDMRSTEQKEADEYIRKLWGEA